MDPIKKILMIILVAIIFVSFFLPWIGVESQVVGSMTKLLTGKEQAKLDTISGYDVPVMANSGESRFMISVIKIFQPGIKDADKKSYLIWGVPFLAVFMLGVCWFMDKNKWIHLVFGIIGVAIFGVAVFKILTTDLDKLVLKVNIGFGIWLLLIGYLCIGILEIVSFMKALKNKKSS